MTGCEGSGAGRLAMMAWHFRLAHELHGLLQIAGNGVTIKRQFCGASGSGLCSECS